MTKLTVVPSAGVPAVFDPTETKTNVAKLEAIIDLARKIKDWELMQQAVDAMIEEQRQFVAWWKENVVEKGRPTKNNVAESGTL